MNAAKHAIWFVLHDNEIRFSQKMGGQANSVFLLARCQPFRLWMFLAFEKTLSGVSYGRLPENNRVVKRKADVGSNSSTSLTNCWRDTDTALATAPPRPSFLLLAASQEHFSCEKRENEDA